MAAVNDIASKPSSKFTNNLLKLQSATTVSHTTRNKFLQQINPLQTQKQASRLTTMVAAVRSMSKYTLFVVVALVATAIFGTGVEAGHECWTGSDDECDRFCHEVLHKRAGHCGGFLGLTCICDK
ncbi:MAG: hypothetical protein JOS17DRAFT_814194 [Linnemannia elongata]|nr:MAG: hypothetical protein JOS17DRAFT_814194 [Linnemannia elongata]